MNLETLQSETLGKPYIDKKLVAWKKSFMRKPTRRTKAAWYYVNAGDNAEYFKSKYMFTFTEPLPPEAIRAAVLKQQLNEQQAMAKMKVERGERLDEVRRELVNLNLCLETLQRWKETQEYQMGEQFYENLVVLVSHALESNDAFILATYSGEFEHAIKAELNKSYTRGDGEFEASADFLVGYEQHGEVNFNLNRPGFDLTGKLEETFKAGVWGNGALKAKVSRGEISAELAAAIAMGAKLSVEGDLKAQMGRLGLGLNGKAEAFAGAYAEVGAKLSGTAKGNFEASIKAGAFAGFKFTAEGTASLSWGSEEIVSATASAEFTFGVGAEFEASIKSSIFDGTTFKIKAEVTLGIGGGTEAEVTVNFSAAGLMAKDLFRSAIYIPTLLKGYKTDLQKQDAKNRHYLDKCIKAVNAAIATAEEEETELERGDSLLVTRGKR